MVTEITLEACNIKAAHGKQHATLMILVCFSIIGTVIALLLLSCKNIPSNYPLGLAKLTQHVSLLLTLIHVILKLMK